MTDQLRGDEVYSLIRAALPEVDADTASITGAQATAVLDRVLASDRIVMLDERAPGATESDSMRPRRRAHRRARLIVVAPIGGAAAAIAAALLIVSLVSAPSNSPKPMPTRPHRVAVVRAKLLAALDTVGSDVLQVEVPNG